MKILLGGGGYSRTRTSLRLDFPVVQGIYRELFKNVAKDVNYHQMRSSFSAALKAKFPKIRSREFFGVSRIILMSLRELIIASCEAK